MWINSCSGCFKSDCVFVEKVIEKLLKRSMDVAEDRWWLSKNFDVFITILFIIQNCVNKNKNNIESWKNSDTTPIRPEKSREIFTTIHPLSRAFLPIYFFSICSYASFLYFIRLFLINICRRLYRKRRKPASIRAAHVTSPTALLDSCVTRAGWWAHFSSSFRIYKMLDRQE